MGVLVADAAKKPMDVAEGDADGVMALGAADPRNGVGDARNEEEDDISGTNGAAHANHGSDAACLTEKRVFGSGSSKPAMSATASLETLGGKNSSSSKTRSASLSGSDSALSSRNADDKRFHLAKRGHDQSSLPNGKRPASMAYSTTPADHASLLVPSYVVGSLGPNGERRISPAKTTSGAM